LITIIASENELWMKLKWIIEAWNLVNPEIVWEVMTEILENQTSENIIFDWFIRNQWNKKTFESIIPEYKVVFFELSKEKAIERLLWRMFNQTTGETFPSWTTTDPETWDELIKRKDDNEAAILKRIDEYMNSTLPTAMKQKEEWKVITVNADQSIENVASEMVEKLRL